MEDAELTRMAIEEIVKELGEHKQQELQQERKVNPLGKPNKRFLGRTLNSVLTHNKRNDDRTQANCQRKLKELDDRLERRYAHHSRISDLKDCEQTQHTRNVSECSRQVYSSPASLSTSSMGEECLSQRRKKSKKYETKKRRKRNKREDRSRSKSRRRSRHKNTSDTYEHKGPNEEGEEAMYETNYCDVAIDDYMQTDVISNAALLTTAYNHQVQQLLCYHALLTETPTRSSNADVMAMNDITETMKIEFKDDISEHISSSNSSSSLCSSLQEDENGILTINVSSDGSCNSRRDSRENNAKAESRSSSSVVFNICSDSSNSSYHSTAEKADAGAFICLDSGSQASNSSSSGINMKNISPCPSISNEHGGREASVKPAKAATINAVEIQSVIDLTED